MYGTRAKLGVLLPSSNVAMEPEYDMMMPEGVRCHYHRYRFAGGMSRDELIARLENAKDYIAEAATIMSHVKPNAMVMGGTGTSFIGGIGYDRMLIEKMRTVNGGIPTTTTVTSVIDAMKACGYKKVSVATPYIEEQSLIIVKFIEDSGFAVVSAKWLPQTVPYGQLPKEDIYQLALDVDHPESEAIFISCTALHTAEFIDELEQELGKPVLTSNQATVWNTLRLAGIQDRIPGFGQLLSQH
jgi:maleate isomerase